MNIWSEHTFVICAYGNSPYLEECIQSLKNQRLSTAVYICTSTPSGYIEKLAEKYGIPVYINEGEGGIGEDWNFAVSKVTTPYVTIVHQDDIYLREYTWEIKKVINRTKKPLIFFTDYGEIREGRRIEKSTLLRIKRMLLTPLRWPFLWNNKWIRRRILSFGNPICCPSVTYARENIPSPPFIASMKSNLDWDAWERYSKIEGAFTYISKILIYHRIHEGSETSAVIGANRRSGEDLEIFCRFWPDPIAKFLGKGYKKGEKYNR